MHLFKCPEAYANRLFAVFAALLFNAVAADGQDLQVQRADPLPGNLKSFQTGDDVENALGVSPLMQLAPMASNRAYGLLDPVYVLSDAPVFRVKPKDNSSGSFTVGYEFGATFADSQSQLFKNNGAWYKWTPRVFAQGYRGVKHDSHNLGFSKDYNKQIYQGWLSWSLREDRDSTAGLNGSNLGQVYKLVEEKWVPSPERFRFLIKGLATFRPHNIAFSWYGQLIAGAADMSYEYFSSRGTLSAQMSLSVTVLEPVGSKAILTRTLTGDRTWVLNRDLSAPMSEDTKGWLPIKR